MDLQPVSTRQEKNAHIALMYPTKSPTIYESPKKSRVLSDVTKVRGTALPHGCY